MPYRGGYPRGSDIKQVRGRYDFAVDGGAASTIVITAEKVPAAAVVLGGFMEVETAVTGAGASVAVQLEAANDIVTAAAISGAPWSTTGRKSVIPVFTGATTVKTTAARDISIVISAADLTAGVFDVVLFYVNMGD
jgi:hypothetical protein